MQENEKTVSNNVEAEHGVRTKKQDKKRKANVKAVAVTAVMSAIGAVLMFVEFPIPIIPSFIKLDFSELPALLTSFAFGPWWGVLVCLIKNLLHLLSGSTMGIGELSNFILGAVFVFVAGIIYKKHKTKKTALIGSAAGAAAMALISLATNYYIIYPLYGTVLNLSQEAIVGMYQAILPSADTLWKDLLIFNLPFTFVKGIIDAALCFFIYKPVSKIWKNK